MLSSFSGKQAFTHHQGYFAFRYVDMLAIQYRSLRAAAVMVAAVKDRIMRVRHSAASVDFGSSLASDPCPGEHQIGRW